MTTPRDVLLAAFRLRYPAVDHETEVDALLGVLRIANLKVLAREPTEAMAHAGGTSDCVVIHGDAAVDVSPDTVWRAMWDAATPGAQP